jgi:hypothetical protein
MGRVDAADRLRSPGVGVATRGDGIGLGDQFDDRACAIEPGETSLQARLGRDANPASSSFSWRCCLVVRAALRARACGVRAAWRLDGDAGGANLGHP